MRAFLVYTTFAVLALVHNVHSARILGLFPHTGKSHQMVFEPLLNKLAERGHHLTVVSFFPQKNPPANYTDVSLEGIAGLGVETIDLAIYEQPQTFVEYSGLGKVVKQIKEFEPLASMALNVCDKLVDWAPLAEALSNQYDVVLVENFNSDCMLGLLHVYGHKAPIVGLLSSNLMHWSAERIGLTDNPSYVPIISSRFTPKMTFIERMENTFLQIYFKLWFRYAVQFKEQEIIEKHFGRKIPDLPELGRHSYNLMLVNVFHSLNGPQPSLPGLVEVGGMHLNPNSKPIPPHIERFVNESENGIVLLSFGSLIKTSTMPKYKEEMILNVLSKIKQRVIWKFEDSDEEGTIIGNILRVKWIPQYELLRHNKVIAFIGHGGLLGMTEAVSAGKPMLVIPFFGDQPCNGAAAAAAGLAKVIPYEEITEESLSEALQQVLSAEMRLNARRLSSIWWDRPTAPLDTAVYSVERVIRWGHQDPLHSVARELNFIQYNLLDVGAAFLVIILVLLLVLKFLLQLFFRFVIGSHKTKEKLH